jgi:hypothetical protein
MEEFINYAKDYFMADFNSAVDLNSFIKKVIAFNIVTDLIIDSFPDLVESIKVGDENNE